MDTSLLTALSAAGTPAFVSDLVPPSPRAAKRLRSLRPDNEPHRAIASCRPTTGAAV